MTDSTSDVQSCYSPNPYNQLTVNFPLGEEEKRIVKSLHGSISVTGGYGSSHNHPILHCERLIAEEVALSLLSGPVLDIGGSPNRHAKYLRSNVWSCCPTITGSDVSRIEKFKGLTNWCDHTVQQCNCVDPECTSLLAIHSLYYLGPSQIAQLMLRGYETLVAVVHRFDSFRGVFYNEASYKLVGDEVQMVILRNPFTYKHNNCCWLRSSNSFEFDIGDGYPMTLCWHLITSVGTSDIYKFNLFRGLLEPDCVYISDMDHLLAAPHYAVLSDGTRMCQDEVYIASHKAYAPRSLIAQLLGIARFKDPDKALLTNITSEFNRLTKQKTYCLSSDDLVRYGSAIIDYVFRLSVVDTVSILSKHRHEHSVLDQRASMLLKEYTVPETWKEYFYYLLAFILKWLIPLFVKTRSVMEQPRFTTVETLATLKPRTDKVVLGSEFKKGVSKEYYAYGPILANHIPLVASSTQHNEEVAVVNRALSNKPVVHLARWKAFEDFVIGNFDRIFVDIEPVKPITFAEWNKNFPEHRKNQHIKALQEVKNGVTELQFNKLATRKAFVKVEKQLVADLNEFDPRLIQGIASEANVLLGPWITAMHRRLKTLWNSNFMITYASGFNNHELGHWITELTNTNLYENDFSRFDRSVHQHALALEEEIYVRFGLQGNARKVLQLQKKTHGYTSHGVYYETEGTRKSGDPNTTLGNSLLNGLLQLYCIYLQIGEETFRDTIRVMVGGDDSVISTNARLDVSLFETCLVELGFAPKMHSRTPHTLTFFSSNFLPTQQGYVLTPRIGKTLAKMSFSLTKKRRPKDWLLGVVIGLKPQFHHVKFVDAYFDRLIDLCQGAKPEIYKTYISALTADSCDATSAALCEAYGIDSIDLDNLLSILAQVVLNSELHHGVFDLLF